MESHLKDITGLIDEYDSLTVPSAMAISDLLRALTAQLFYLEKYRSDYHKQYSKIMFDFQGSVSGAKIKADNEVPELYLIRRISNAAYQVVGAMRSQISTINKEN